MDAPIEPDPSECCGSGCDPCIFDVYEQQLKNHDKNLSLPPKTGSKNCISRTKYTTFVLQNINKISHDTYLYTFIYKNKENEELNDVCLCYEPGQHLLIRSGVENNYFTRAYTPIPNKYDLSFDVLVKLYPFGKMSAFFRKIKTGAETKWRGPYGEYKINTKLKNILMICQGTGIVPFYTILNKLLENEECETFIKLFYCCNSVYFHEQIYEMKSFWNFTYELFIKCFDCDANIKKYGEVVHERRLDKCDVGNYLDSKIVDKDCLQILICGNDSFSECIKNILDECGVNKEVIYIF